MIGFVHLTIRNRHLSDRMILEYISFKRINQDQTVYKQVHLNGIFYHLLQTLY